MQGKRKKGSMGDMGFFGVILNSATTHAHTDNGSHTAVTDPACEPPLAIAEDGCVEDRGRWGDDKSHQGSPASTAYSSYAEAKVPQKSSQQPQTSTIKLNSPPQPPLTAPQKAPASPAISVSQEAKEESRALNGIKSEPPASKAQRASDASLPAKQRASEAQVGSERLHSRAPEDQQQLQKPGAGQGNERAIKSKQGEQARLPPPPPPPPQPPARPRGRSKHKPRGADWRPPGRQRGGRAAHPGRHQ